MRLPPQLVRPDEGTPEEVIGALDFVYDEMAFHAREQARYVASAVWEDRLPEYGSPDA